MQNNLMTISLVIISLVLSANFYLDRVHPFLVLKTNEEIYLGLYAECEEAKFFKLEAENSQEAMATKRSLIASADVQLLACEKKTKLENMLLASGVKYTTIKLLESP